MTTYAVRLTRRNGSIFLMTNVEALYSEDLLQVLKEKARAAMKLDPARGAVLVRLIPLGASGNFKVSVCVERTWDGSLSEYFFGTAVAVGVTR